jgi:hypothetical protein
LGKIGVFWLKIRLVYTKNVNNNYFRRKLVEYILGRGEIESSSRVPPGGNDNARSQFAELDGHALAEARAAAGNENHFSGKRSLRQHRVFPVHGYNALCKYIQSGLLESGKVRRQKKARKK